MGNVNKRRGLSSAFLIKPSLESNIVKILKLIKIGDSLGVQLPESVVKKFNLTEGDVLYCLETPANVQLFPCTSELEAAIKAYEITSVKFASALKKMN